MPASLALQVLEYEQGRWYQNDSAYCLRDFTSVLTLRCHHYVVYQKKINLVICCGVGVVSLMCPQVVSRAYVPASEQPAKCAAMWHCSNMSSFYACVKVSRFPRLGQGRRFSSWAVPQISLRSSSAVKPVPGEVCSAVFTAVFTDSRLQPH
jgi:hypothetical protein